MKFAFAAACAVLTFLAMEFDHLWIAPAVLFAFATLDDIVKGRNSNL